MSSVKTNPYKSKDISAYFIGDYIDEQSVKSKLQEVGFEVIATYSLLKNGTIVIFTDDILKKEGLRPGRTNAVILRLFIDEKMKKISITNPIYFGKAFMQDEFDYELFTRELTKILKGFPNLEASEDKMRYEELAEYNFMIGMPSYEDVDIVSKGKNSALLYPKYYIAVSYPLLSMRDFMSIATLPHTITKELSKPFE